MKRSLNFGFLATILTLAIMYAISFTGITEKMGFQELIIFGLIFFPVTSFLFHYISNR